MNVKKYKLNRDVYMSKLTFYDTAVLIVNSSTCHCQTNEGKLCPIHENCKRNDAPLPVKECIRSLVCWLSTPLEETERKSTDLVFVTTQQDIDDMENGKYDDPIEDYFGYALAIFADKVHENAVNHGWWEKEPSFLEIAALIHSEVSEAVQAYRKGEDEHIGEELADVVLRILDYCSAKNINIEKELVKKHEFNLTRPYKHGGKRI